MFTYPKQYKFTQTWFDPMIPNWNELFKYYLKENSIKSVLEIGCFEGRATVYLLLNHLDKDVTYEVVDTFEGTPEESGMIETVSRLAESNFIYENFMHNMSQHTGIDLKIRKGYSQLKLPQLYQEGNKYDFIYIDASHRADDTFVDAYYAHKMLNPGGLLIFDDFGWKDPARQHPVDSPELGVRSFFTMYSEEYTVVMSGYQVGAIKNK